MSKAKTPTSPMQAWLSKNWVQWLLASVVFFLLSWLFMGNAINHCSTATTALGSDTTGGFAWAQWASGNDLTWGHTDKSNYPFGNNLNNPQSITSTILIFLYKLFSTLSTPICGINLVILLGYMSTALVMFGLVKWLLKRFDIALFAGFAAAFVPFHQLKAQSHLNYVSGSIFIAMVWAYLWFIKKPSYKKAILLALVNASGFYFDGYFVLISAIVIGALFSSSFVIDLARIIHNRQQARRIIKLALSRLKYLAFSSALLALLLTPILLTYISQGTAINQSLASVRSNIKSETMLYGVRPIEFVLPSYNNALMPDGYAAWRATKLHGSNFSESTLYVGYTVIVLAAVCLIYLVYHKNRLVKLQEISYTYLVFVICFVLLACLALSLPAYAFIAGHSIRTPSLVLVKLTANWRVLSRLFLAMDPLIIILASLGLYMLTRRKSKGIQLAIVAVCGLVLFLEYLPTPLHPTGDLFKNAPETYKQLQKDTSVRLVAEYPLADFVYAPEIFTFQPVHNKTLLNSSDGSISRGPFDSSIAGLNDKQTLGALKKLGVDLIITHGFYPDNPALKSYYHTTLTRKPNGMINVPANEFSYKMDDSVVPRTTLLIIKKGYESLSVDKQQISHRFITKEATIGVFNIKPSPSLKKYNVNFDASSICPANAQVTIMQSGQTMWSTPVGNNPTPINLTVGNEDFYVKTADCSIDITNMSAESVP